MGKKNKNRKVCVLFHPNMDDDLILNLVRLVRNGRVLARGCEEFIFGGVRMMDCGPCTEDYARLQDYYAKEGNLSEVALVVSIRGAIVEIWRFQDFRSLKVPFPAPSSAHQANSAAAKMQAYLKIFVRVIFAYLRIHELFSELTNIRISDVEAKLVTDMGEVPTLEADTCSKSVWAVDGVASVKVLYNKLWRIPSPNPKTSPLIDSNTTPRENSVIELLRLRATAPVPINTRGDRCGGSLLGMGSDSAGSARSVPSPLFAPSQMPSSVGSTRLSFTNNPMKSPMLQVSYNPLPCATNTDDSFPLFRPLPQADIAAVLARGEALTPAVRGHTFSNTPSFVAGGGYSSSGEDEGDVACTDDQLVDLLEICDGISILEEAIDINMVLQRLDTPLLRP